MVWKIKFEEKSQKELKKLDVSIAERIIKFLKRVQKLDDPRSIGEALHGSTLGAFWKYRIGDYRLISKIEDKNITIIIVKIGHRKNIYL